MVGLCQHDTKSFIAKSCRQSGLHVLAYQRVQKQYHSLDAVAGISGHSNIPVTTCITAGAISPAVSILIKRRMNPEYHQDHTSPMSIAHICSQD